MAPAFNSKFLDEFIITDILGEGAFGTVFEVENSLDRAKYAVKRIAVPPSNDLDRALKEVRALAQLDHPGIIRYNNAWVEKPPNGWQDKADKKMYKNCLWGTNKCTSIASSIPYDDGTEFIYIQMQLCKESLESWLEKNTSQASRHLPRMMAWFKQMVSAVAYIHENGLIHRDLKISPNNILFVNDDTIKVCDLGIATSRFLMNGEEYSIIRSVAGTEDYMSPEQLSEEPRYSSKTDVYTLGLILAELCVPCRTQEEKDRLFLDIRRGTRSDLFTDITSATLVGMLTQRDSQDRPTCREILDNMFLA